MDAKRPGKLNFNAPLLSIKRPGRYIAEETSCSNSAVAARDTSNRIPFCWEQAPGKPKNTLERNDDFQEADTPRPKLPPSRWHPQPGPASGTTSNNQDPHDHDDGCDADVDDDSDNDEALSDAADVLSLTQAIDIVEKAEKYHGSEGLDPRSTAEPSEMNGLTLHSFVQRGSLSPSYIIERFLPDATALAASSALAVSKNLNKTLPYFCSYPESYASPAVRPSYSSPKGCGLQMLLPWRMKHKICGVKSPVRQDSPVLQPKSVQRNKRNIT